MKPKYLNLRSQLYKAYIKTIWERVHVLDQFWALLPFAVAYIYLINFCAILLYAGELYELDGRKSGAISHGPSSPNTLLRVNIFQCSGYYCIVPERHVFSKRNWWFDLIWFANAYREKRFHNIVVKWFHCWLLNVNDTWRNSDHDSVGKQLKHFTWIKGIIHLFRENFIDRRYFKIWVCKVRL